MKKRKLYLKNTRREKTEAENVFSWLFLNIFRSVSLRKSEMKKKKREEKGKEERVLNNNNAGVEIVEKSRLAPKATPRYAYRLQNP